MHLTYSVFAWEWIEWFDEFLSWDPKEHQGLERIVVPAKDIWIPDLVLQNTADKFYNDEVMKYFRVELRHTGKVLFVPGGKISTSCPLNMRYFPFDYQTCMLKVSMWVHTCKEAKVYTIRSDVDLE